MKQRTTPSIPLIIGNGRLARHWKHYLDLEQVKYLGWNRSSSLRLAEFLPQYHSQISCVYLLISDSAIEGVYKEHRSLLPHSTLWFHASGALNIETMHDAHPMMTFADELYDLETYRAISFTTASDLKLIETTLLFDLQNIVSKISPDEKARYHALCVLGAAGTGSLWSLLEKEWQSMGMPPSAWKPYQAQIFANLISQGSRAITGPWVRGDDQTTSANLNSLGNGPAEKLYQVLKGVFDEYREH
jgi:2-dehydropantoate 2-reductase